MTGERFGRSAPLECLPRPAVHSCSDCSEVADAPAGEVGAFGKVLTQQAIRVLVRAALPRRVRVAEIDLQSDVDLELNMLGKFGSLIPGQGPTQLFRQARELSSDGGIDGQRAVPSQRRP